MGNTGNPTEYKQFLSQRIIAAANEAFTSRGIRAVKMDDLAKSLSISKRTLYEIFDDKEQLLLACIQESNKTFRKEIEAFIVKTSPTPTAIILEFYRMQMLRLSNVTPDFFTEIDRYPKVVEWLKQNKKQNHGEIKRFFDQGITEGYFVNNIDFALATLVGDAIREYVMNNQLFRKYSMKKIFHDLIFTFIRGFCTQKGIKELDSNIAKIKV